MQSAVAGRVGKEFLLCSEKLQIIGATREKELPL